MSHLHRPHCSMPFASNFRPVPFGYSLIVPNGTMEVARLRQDSADGVYNGKRPVSSYVCSRNRQRVIGNSCIGYKTAFGEVRQIAPRKLAYGK